MKFTKKSGGFSILQSYTNAKWKIFSFVSIALLISIVMPLRAFCAEPEIDAESAILIEAETGKVLFEYNADDALPPASVTKIMTLLLVMEAVDGDVIALDDIVQVSDNASKMGGSQVFLAPGEQICVEDLIKSVVIASANDAAVALAEYVCGSEEIFVERMNQRAAELGMTNTFFENTNGLDDTTVNHVTSARDIAIMSSELIKHKKILEYSSTWMDSIRNGAFTLTNTNRLIRFYKGATGLKTGSTSKAKFCISATAMRDGMHLISVIMGSSSRDARNESAKKLLDYGFANYCYVCYPSAELDAIELVGANCRECKIFCEEYHSVLNKSEGSGITVEYDIPECIEAPVHEGDVIGRIVYKSNGEYIGEADVKSMQSVDKISFSEQFINILKIFLMF